mgnify:CR=1 FL=1
MSGGGSGGHEVQILDPGGADGLIHQSLPGQDIRETRRHLDLEHGMLNRTPHIGVDQQDSARQVIGQHQGKMECEQALALAAFGAPFDPQLVAVGDYERNIAKVSIAIAKGKKLHDKRADMKEKTLKREAQQAMKNRDY